MALRRSRLPSGFLALSRPLCTLHERLSESLRHREKTYSRPAHERTAQIDLAVFDEFRTEGSIELRDMPCQVP